MKSRWLERTLAVVCALVLTAAVMSKPVFTQAEAAEASSEAEALEESYVVFGDSSGNETQLEVTDNRTTVPYYVGQTEYGECTLIDGTPYVNVTAFLSALGVGGTAYDSGSSLTLSGGALTMTAEAGAIYFICNDRYLYVEDGVQSIDGSICLPVEALVKCTGASVTWDRVEWRITVEEGELSPLTEGASYYSETDVYWLSRVIYAEAGGQSLAAQAAIGSVVMNRVADEAFPDTVYEVIFAKNQFDVVINGMVYMTPDETAEIAAKLVLEGYDMACGATYFTREGDDVDDGVTGEEGYDCVTQVEDIRFLVPA
ncbi:MAG: cell wall hydrolase [Oscillospiraceae bacterium]|nr:cell wall hydrolase [Oscillospiraceae bacterium]